MTKNILNRFGLAMIHIPMLVDLFNKSVDIEDNVFSDINLWQKILSKNYSCFEFSWDDLCIEKCKFTKRLLYYIYTFPEPQKSSQAKYGLVIISPTQDGRRARYFTLETSQSIDPNTFEATSCYAVCEPTIHSHSYIDQFTEDSTIDNFVLQIYNRYYSHIKPSAFETIFNRSSLFNREIIYPTSTPLDHVDPELFVVISNRAYNTISNLSMRDLSIMSGGILLGHHLDNGCWIIVDVVDSGPKTIANKENFEYDGEYVNREANRLANLYSIPLELLGLWLYHPNGLDYYSRQSDDANYQFANMNKGGCLCGIVTNDGTMHLKLKYLCSNRYPNSVDKDSGYVDIEYEVGDDLIPENYLAEATL